MTEIVKTEAFVLRVRKYGESSKIVTLYTENFGKINAIAKGARKLKSKFLPCLDVFAYISVLIYKKPSTRLHLLSDCDLIKSYQGLAEDLEKYENALKIFELIYKILHDEEENRKLFKLLKLTIENLEQIEENKTNIYFYFLIKFGEILGYAYNFQKCSRCNHNFITSDISDRKIIFDFSRGGAICEKCESGVIQPRVLNLGIFKILNRFEAADEVQKITNIKLGKNEVVQIEKFLFDYLCYHISDLKELKSQKILKNLNI